MFTPLSLPFPLWSIVSFPFFLSLPLPSPPLPSQNMFQTLKYLALLGVPTFIAGNRLLRRIARARKWVHRHSPQLAEDQWSVNGQGSSGRGWGSEEVWCCTLVSCLSVQILKVLNSRSTVRELSLEDVSHNTLLCSSCYFSMYAWHISVASSSIKYYIQCKLQYVCVLCVPYMMCPADLHYIKYTCIRILHCNVHWVNTNLQSHKNHQFTSWSHAKVSLYHIHIYNVTAILNVPAISFVKVYIKYIIMYKIIIVIVHTYIVSKPFNSLVKSHSNCYSTMIHNHTCHTTVGPQCLTCWLNCLFWYLTKLLVLAEG